MNIELPFKCVTKIELEDGTIIDGFSLVPIYVVTPWRGEINITFSVPIRVFKAMLEDEENKND